MTDGTSQGLFIVVAIVIFGIFTLTAYILFEDTLSPALASMFTDAIEKSDNQLNKEEKPLSNEQWVKELENQGYVVAKDDDFEVNWEGNFIYKGDDVKVIVPNIINEVPITKVKYMFSSYTPVEAVAINNPDLIDMSYMFYNSRATTLDLSSFDTSKVTNMNGMFQNSQATTLDLSSFDTSNVTSMETMFTGSLATTLDLSSFDTSNVTNMGIMFLNSKATSGYARTAEDAVKFNNSTNKPTALTFTVK